MLWWGENELDSDMYKWTASRMLSCVWPITVTVLSAFAACLKITLDCELIYLFINFMPLFLFCNKQEHSIWGRPGHRKHCGRDWAEFQSLTTPKWIIFFFILKTHTHTPNGFHRSFAATWEWKLECLLTGEEEKPMDHGCVIVGHGGELCAAIFDVATQRKQGTSLVRFIWRRDHIVIVCNNVNIYTLLLLYI